MVADHARLVVDTRGVMRNYPGAARVVGLSGGVERERVAEPVLLAAS